jgi:hypothetical protein
MSAYITSRFDEDSGEVALHLADMSQVCALLPNT